MKWMITYTMIGMGQYARISPNRSMLLTAPVSAIDWLYIGGWRRMWARTIVMLRTHRNGSDNESDCKRGGIGMFSNRCTTRETNQRKQGQDFH